MECTKVVKMDARGRVMIPIAWRKEHKLTGGELLEIKATRIELVNVDSIDEFDKDVPGCGKHPEGGTITKTHETHEVSQ